MKVIRRLVVLVAAALVLLVSAGSASAAVPKIITQQGRLVDNEGMPVTGDLNFEFNIYDVETEGTPLYTETQTITLENGYFSTRVGETTVIPDSLFSGAPLWIGVTVGTDSEMAPRQPIASVPYAFKAASADHATTADSATTAATATDVTGTIHPTSVVVNGVTVINATGNWTGPAVRVGNSLAVTQGAAVTSSSGVGTASATCPAGSSATGGGCTFTASASDYENASLKQNTPNVGTGKPNGWLCTCVSLGTTTCTVTPRVICTPD